MKYLIPALLIVLACCTTQAQKPHKHQWNNYSFAGFSDPPSFICGYRCLVCQKDSTCDPKTMPEYKSYKYHAERQAKWQQIENGTIMNEPFNKPCPHIFVYTQSDTIQIEHDHSWHLISSTKKNPPMYIHTFVCGGCEKQDSVRTTKTYINASQYLNKGRMESNLIEMSDYSRSIVCIKCHKIQKQIVIEVK